MTRILTLSSRVLRDPVGVIDEAERGDRLAALAPGLLLVAVACSAIFGMVVGSGRGGLQIGFAAVKMPLLLWIPVALALPATRALWMACQVEVSAARMAAAGLVAMARTAILAAAAGPVLWLFDSVSPNYHVSVLAFSAVLVAVGLPGMAVVPRAMPSGGRRRVLAMAASSLVLGLCVMQTGWLLRPFVGRPGGEVTFLRPLEEDIFSGLAATGRSATGDYSQDWEPEPRGLLRGDP